MPNRRLLLAVCTLHTACLPDSSPQEPETASETTAAPVAATTAEESRPGVMTTTEDPEGDPTTGSDDTSGAGEVPGCEPGATEACRYGGPSGTEGVGTCVAATRRCDDGAWGPCTGEVLPRAEDCRTDLDESCDGQAACDGQVLWARSFGERPGGEPGGTSVQDITADGNGDLWISGQFNESLRFGDQTWEAESNGAYVLAQIDGDGAPGYSFGDEQVGAFAHGYALTTDGAGRVAISAGYQGKLKVHASSPVYDTTETLASSAVGMITTTGEYQWSRSLRATDHGFVGISALAFNGAGELWMAGNFSVDFDLGAAEKPLLFKNHGDWDTFLVKLTPDGDIARVDRMGDDGFQSIHGMAIDATGAIWLVGEFDGMLEFKGGALYAGVNANDSHDMFVVKLDADGTWQWGRVYGDDKNQRFLGVELDGDGNAVVVGEYRGKLVNLGDKPLMPASPGSAIVAAKFSPDGDVSWAREWPCEGICGTRGVAVDGAGQSVIIMDAGSNGTITVDGQVFVVGPSDSASIVVKLDGNGDTLWATELLPGRPKVAVGPLGEVFVAGEFDTEASFADDAIYLDAGPGDSDLYVLKLRP